MHLSLKVHLIVWPGKYSHLQKRYEGCGNQTRWWNEKLILRSERFSTYRPECVNTTMSEA